MYYLAGRNLQNGDRERRIRSRGTVTLTISAATQSDEEAEQIEDAEEEKEDEEGSATDNLKSSRCAVGSTALSVSFFIMMQLAWLLCVHCTLTSLAIVVTDCGLSGVSLKSIISRVATAHMRTLGQWRRTHSLQLLW